MLVEAGADLLAKDALGLTPLDLADKMEHTEVMEILRGAVDRQEGPITAPKLLKSSSFRLNVCG